MNTHQKVFFTCAVSLGLVAAAFAATPAPAVKAAPVELERITVVGHRMAPEVALEQALVLGHRSDVQVASNSSKTAALA
jgi:hypothetical protein